MVPESRARDVTRAVRTDAGTVTWVRYPTSDYTPLERLGREVYIREGCWYCHSQYVRPVAGEQARWGPVSEAGEYAWDLPHLLSTRRIGPDLSRVGLKYSDDWHYAHLWTPRLVVPESIMPSFRWLFQDVTVPVHREGEVVRLEATPAVTRYFTMDRGKPLVLFPDESGLTFVTPRPDGGLPIDGIPVLDLTHLGGRSTTTAIVRLVIPARETVGLVRYLQKLGTSRGVWRDVFEPQNPAVTAIQIPRGQDVVARGRAVYERRCIGCHGARGDGNGKAATFLSPRPRDFTTAVFKFRTTPSGTLPTDGDLYRTITRGVRWTAMPTWHEVPDQDRRAVVAYIKTFSARWREEPRPTAAPLPPPPRPSAELLMHGKTLYRSAKCYECHGDGGKGDGPAAAQLRDDFERPIRPTDFTRGQFKAGAAVTDVFRALTLGLDGTPMPSFGDALTDEERWAIAYYVLSLSAWADPLTGEKLDPTSACRAGACPPPSSRVDGGGQAPAPQNATGDRNPSRN
jgi:cytochrome c oxidase cbb3-type subunit 2